MVSTNVPTDGFEPEIYRPDSAGYRHTGTVLITENDIEQSYYQRDFESDIIR